MAVKKQNINNNIKDGGEDNTQADNAVADVFFFGINPHNDTINAKIIPRCCQPDKAAAELNAIFDINNVAEALGRTIINKISNPAFDEDTSGAFGLEKFLFIDDTMTVRVVFCSPKCRDDCKTCNKWQLAIFKTEQFLQAIGYGKMLKSVEGNG